MSKSRAAQQKHSVLKWSHVFQCVMRTFGVIITHPLLRGLSDLIQIPKYVGVQYGTSVTAIESLYVTVLSRSSNFTTRWAGMYIDISCAITVRSASSSTFITRNLRPLSTTSLTKSIPISLHARVMLTTYSATISDAISFLTSGSKVFFYYIPQYLVVKSQVCVHLLQPSVLLLQGFQLLKLTDIHHAVFDPPVVQCTPGYAVTPAYGFNGSPFSVSLTAFIISASLCFPFFIFLNN